MAVITGLKNIQKVIEKPKGAIDAPKATWLKLEDGQGIKVRFINEVDGDSKFYDENRGLAIVVAEHTNPKDYRRKAVCTMDDEGRCYGCEMARKEPKTGWKARLRFYCNVLVDDGNKDPYVAIWSQGVGPKVTSTNTIFEYASDNGSISNLIWRLKRNGTGTQTNYVLIPIAPDTETFDWSGIEPYDLQKSAIRNVNYPDQESFYMGLIEDTTTSTAVDW
jgi:hypothetical protein